MTERKTKKNNKKLKTEANKETVETAHNKGVNEEAAIACGNNGLHLTFRCLVVIVSVFVSRICCVATEVRRQS